MDTWNVDSIPDQHGRVAVITGASGGLGFEAARKLAGKGAVTVLACRSAEKAEIARRAIVGEHPAADVRIGALDVSSLRSVEEFSVQALRDHARIDLLINNAGIMATPQERSADGFEMQLATNHLGHFALTCRLLPRIAITPGSRVVAVASIAAQAGKIDFDDLMGERHYDAWKAYNQSKLANLMFALELRRRLSRVGASTLALTAHPGASTTKLFATPGAAFVKRFLSPLMRMMFQSPEQGVLPILFAATAPRAEAGGYYGPGGFKELKGPPAPARVPRQALDEATAKRLWEVSEQLVKLRFPL